MLFSSIPYIYYFLPCVLILYFAVPDRMKNAVLLLSSLFFYGWGEPRYLVFMIFSIVQGYFSARLAEKHRGDGRGRAACAISVALSLALLAYCKYADFFIGSFSALTGLSIPLLGIALPIGISFYTFQVLSYVIDVYRGDVPAQRNLINLATYIAMFPQLIAGPIVRYSDIAPELESRRHTLNGAAAGAGRFTVGLAKKILIANVMAELVSAIKGSNEKTMLFYWIYAVAYMLQVYFDFSGYSDMAIGLGRIFGFTFSENFNYPYISKSITEFWRRWHISLGSWFRDYLYIPLGGNRVSVPRHILNILIVWMATGLWHGAAWNFVLWGLFFAIMLIIEKHFLAKPLKALGGSSHVYVLFFVMLSFVLFDASSVGDAFSYFRAMFGGAGIAGTGEVTMYYLRSYAIPTAIAIIGATPLPKHLYQRFAETKIGGNVLTFVEPIGVLVLLAVCTAYLIDGSFNPFLYFRF